MPMTRRGRPVAGDASDHARLGRAGHRAHDDGVEEDAQLRLLALQLDHPVGEAEPAQAMVRSPRRDGVWRAARLSDLGQRQLPALLEADAEAGLHQAHVRAHDARQLDVADPVVDRIGPIDPALLDQDATHPQVSGDRGHLPGMVGLDTTDGHERVRAVRERVRGEVLQLAHLVATEGQAGVRRPRAWPTASRHPDDASAGPAAGWAKGRTSAVCGRRYPGSSGLQQPVGLEWCHARAGGRPGCSTRPGRRTQMAPPPRIGASRTTIVLYWKRASTHVVNMAWGVRPVSTVTVVTPSTTPTRTSLRPLQAAAPFQK